jgi:hypothetical protein
MITVLLGSANFGPLTQCKNGDPKAAYPLLSVLPLRTLTLQIQ